MKKFRFFTISFPYFFLVTTLITWLIVNNTLDILEPWMFFTLLFIYISLNILFFGIAVVGLIIFCMMCFKEDKLLELAKFNMKIRIYQIPAHIILFILEIILFSLIFTIGFSFILICVSIATLLINSILACVVIYQNSRRIDDQKHIILFVFFHFFFIIDLFISIKLYKKLLT